MYVYMYKIIMHNRLYVLILCSGSPVSFSNPILWHRGQNLVGSGEPRRTSQGVYQSFFHWFSDHSNPGRDDIAQVHLS